MSMKDWITKIDNFLEFNEYPLLKNKGEVSKKEADEKVVSIYEEYRPIQDRNYKSDYDESVEKSKKYPRKIRIDKLLKLLN